MNLSLPSSLFISTRLSSVHSLQTGTDDEVSHEFCLLFAVEVLFCLNWVFVELSLDVWLTLSQVVLVY